MTENERALLDLVCIGASVSDYGKRMMELRDAVLLERLPPESKEAWQAAFRAVRLARINLDQVTTDLGLIDVPLTPWKKEVEEEVP